MIYNKVFAHSSGLQSQTGSLSLFPIAKPTARDLTRFASQHLTEKSCNSFVNWPLCFVLVRFYPSGEAFGTASDDATVSSAARTLLHFLTDN